MAGLHFKKKKKVNWNKIRKLSLHGFFFFVIVFFAYLGTLYALQDNLLFHPDNYYRSPQMTGFYNFKEQPLQMSDGASVMTWFAPGDKTKPALLFFHGNAQQIATFAPQLNAFAQKGYPVLMMEYRGFGGTAGKMKQDTVFQDAAQAFDYLKTQGYSKIVVYGYSFGCAVAMGLTQYRQPDGVILTAPFASLSQIVNEKAPFSSLVLKGDYPSDEYAQNLKTPLLIMHGKKDKLIPYHHGEHLYAVAQSHEKDLLLLDGETHRSIFFEPKNLSLIMNWLQKRES